MNQTLDAIQTTIHKHFPTLREDFGVSVIGIFGSVARGDETGKSDVDIMVKFSRTPGFFKFVKLEQYLTHILKRNVDLVTENALKPAIRPGILRDVTYV